MEYQEEYKIIPPKKLSLNFGELWQFRELFFFFTWRDIKVKYKQTALGFLWAILQPLLMMLIFTLFFGRGLKVPSDNIPYPIFVFSGLLLWNVFSSGITNAGNSMVNQSNIIKKIYFPRLIIPISSILVSLFDFLMAFIIFIGLFVYFHFPVDISMFTLSVILGLALTVLTTFGVGCLLAALNVKYRDFRYVIPFMVQALMFLTPVIYPVSLFNNKYLQILLSLNPMAGAIDLVRSSLTGGSVSLHVIVSSIISALFFFFIGLFYFRKTESYFADIA